MEKSEAVFVIKTVERCNINCTYCYFFNKADKSYKEHPPLMPKSTIEQTTSFIAQGAKELHLKNVVICFHGGEPLMQKRDQFELFCESLIEKIQSSTKISFSVQTNGLLISEEWLDLLAKYNTTISVSLDGPQLLHDRYRIDHKGRGTFHRVINKLKIIDNHPKYKNKGYSILSVINEEFDAKNIYQFFFKELQIKHADFLIPDNTHDDPFNMPAKKLAVFLIELFNIWINDNPKKINIRFFNSILNGFFNKSNTIYGHGPTKNLSCLPLITISSNGDLAPSDEFRSADKLLMKTNQNVSNTTLEILLEHDHFQKIESSLNILPSYCQPCVWKKICHGGNLVNRYSKQNEFNNPSIFCSDLKQFYQNVCISLLQKGMAVNQVVENITC